MHELGMNDEFCSLVPRPWRRQRRVAREQQARPDRGRADAQGRVRFDRGIHVPEDEIGFFVVEAIPSGEE
jgi:hypothetical protein